MAVPEKTNVLTPRELPPLPNSWSSLTWQQLCQVWAVKQRYGGNADVARAAAMLVLALGSRFEVQGSRVDEQTGEQQYELKTPNSNFKPQTCHVVTARELSYLSMKAIPWFDYPYGDPGEKAEKDEKGKIVKEGRAPVRGYVSLMRDAMIPPTETIVVQGSRVQGSRIGDKWWRGFLTLGGKHFALPQAACNNLTWQQYRSLQAIAPNLFKEDIEERTSLNLQAQFLSHILTPRSIAILDTSGSSIRIRPHWEYRYDAERAEGLVSYFEKKLAAEFRVQEKQSSRSLRKSRLNGSRSSRFKEFDCQLSTLFHICFQVYQTAISYYAASFPTLFDDDGKTDPLRDALTGEVGTINTIMKYAGYAEQQQVYDSFLPFVLDILNKMTKEAKEIEKMNSKIKRK